MTLSQFEKAIQKYRPEIHFRQAGSGDVVGIFAGSSYLLRINKGEIPLYTYRQPYYEKHSHALKKLGEKHRGRMQALGMLVNMRWLTSRQAQAIMWGSDEA
jgi:hypothetical protein